MARDADERQRPGAGADLGHGRVPAAQPPAGGDVDHGAPARGRVPAALLDRRAGDCRLRRQHLGRPPAEPDAAPRPARPRFRPPRSAAASTRRACRRSSGRRTTRTTTACSSTSSTGAKAKRPGRSLKRGLWDPIVVWDTTSVPDGTYVLKVAASRRAVELPRHGADRRARERAASTSTTRRRDRAAAGDARGARTVVRSSSATSSRRCSAWSIRSTRAAGGRSIRRTASPDSRREEFEVTLEESEAGRSVIIRATDAMNNVATAVATGSGRSRDRGSLQLLRNRAAPWP